MQIATRDAATRDTLIAALYNVPDHGKAEIVDGAIVLLRPAGARPGRAAGRIQASLLNHEESLGGGYAIGGNAAFIVELPNRQSFSPDVAWYTGSLGEDEMGFISGPPTFAVEVRSEGDYGPAAERAIAAKIADYLAAGTKVVWDVDLLAADVVKVYRAGVDGVAAIYCRGDVAEAQPAVPGWTLAVDRIFG